MWINAKQIENWFLIWIESLTSCLFLSWKNSIVNDRKRLFVCENFYAILRHQISVWFRELDRIKIYKKNTVVLLMLLSVQNCVAAFFCLYNMTIWRRKNRSEKNKFPHNNAIGFTNNILCGLLSSSICNGNFRISHSIIHIHFYFVRLDNANTDYICLIHHADLFLIFQKMCGYKNLFKMSH